MSLLSKHLFGHFFWVLKSFPLHLLFCSFMKLCAFPFKGCFCHLKPKWNTWSIKSPLFSWRTSAMLHRRQYSKSDILRQQLLLQLSQLLLCLFCSSATTNFTFKKTTARVKVKTARLPLEKMHVLQPALFLHPESRQRFRIAIWIILSKYLHRKKNLKMTEGRHQRLLIAIEVWWSRLWACCQNIFLADLFGFWKAFPCTCSFVASWSFARSLSRDASATWSLKTTLGASKLLCFPGELLQCSIESSTRNLISWDSNSSFSCFSCCCACVLQHCNKFYLQEHHSKSKSQHCPTASWEDARSAASSLSTSWITTEIQTKNCRIAKLQSGSSCQSIF